METERTRPEFRMRLESRLLFAAALVAILMTLLAGHNRAIAQEKTPEVPAPASPGLNG
jgi:hypothetical protein